ncbi:MAG TPA: DoxX family protein [Pseudomonadales bacterium]|nr:DoxX family protein [Pseudomonadales bacterium]
MAKFMEPLGGYTYALLRIVTGLLFMFHGSQKLLGWPLEPMAGLPTFVTYIAGPIELIGGALVAIGLLTRWSAFLCSGLMAAAYWLAHGSKAFFPILNGGELALVFCFAFLYISSHGPGMWSLDKMRGTV